MDEQIFWDLIDSSKPYDISSRVSHANLLYQKLSIMTENDIIAFENKFFEIFYRAYDWNLWGAAILIRCFCSDDSFVYFLGWLIAQGQDIFNSALKDPDSLYEIVKDMNGIDTENEEILYVATNAYENKAGELIPNSNSSFQPIRGESKEIQVWIEKFPNLGRLYRNNCAEVKI